MLDSSLTYKLASIADDAIGRAEVLFVKRFGLDVRTLRVLRLVEANPGTTFTELTVKTKFERSATSRMLAQLIKGGLVRRRIDTEDARHFRLHATAAGKALCESAAPVSLELEELMLAPLDDAEKREFLATLEKLNTWINDGYGGEMQRRFPEASASARNRTRGPA